MEMKLDKLFIIHRRNIKNVPNPRRPKFILPSPFPSKHPVLTTQGKSLENADFTYIHTYTHTHTYILTVQVISGSTRMIPVVASTTRNEVQNKSGLSGRKRKREGVWEGGSMVKTKTASARGS